MFYQQELLSKQKSGLAVVWLLSTIGPRAAFGKKVPKKDLLKSDVAKVCKTIADPPEPLALRLSASLLLGTARLFGQQVTLFSGDVERLSAALKRAIVDMSKPIATNLDMANSTARRDAITVPDVEIGLDYGAGLGMDDYAFLLFDEQNARGEEANEEDVGFTTQDLFMEDADEAAYQPPGSSTKKKATKGKGKQRPLEPLSAAATPARKANNTLEDHELNLLEDGEFMQPYLNENDLSAQNDFAAIMGEPNEPFFGLDAGLDFLNPDLSTRHSRTGGGSTNAGGGMDLHLNLDFGMELPAPLSDRSARRRAGSVAARYASMAPEEHPGQAGFFDQMDLDQLHPEPRDRSTTPRESQAETEKENTPVPTPKKKKRTTKKAKKGEAILDKTTTLKDQDFAGARAAYSKMLQDENEEIEKKVQEKNAVDRAKTMIFGVPGLFQTAPELNDLWAAIGPKQRKRADGSKEDATARKRTRKDTPQPDPEAETGRDRAAYDQDAYMQDYQQDYQQDFMPGQASRRPSRDIEIGRAVSRAGSAVPSRHDDQMPWNIAAFDQGQAPSYGDTSQISGGRRSFHAETPVSARKRNSSRRGSELEFGSPGLLARPQSRQGSVAGLTTDLNLDGQTFEAGRVDGEGFTFEESDMSTAAQASKAEQDDINFLAYAKRQADSDGHLLFSDIAPITVTASKVAAQAFYHLLVLASRSMITIVKTDEAGEILLSI